ncbi:ABC transporter substrate-binding protein [Mesorhizobium sp. PUT5]|uniref:ABC transporter substrate-binding protein n=1 Tax=Mesorhizobium sp. PUT5 TaxID=3454629 RepID=UPI003FA4BC05
MIRSCFLSISLIGVMSCATVADAKVFVYCSEASPSGFDPAIATSGTTYDAVGHTIYNRLVEFKKGTTEVVPALAESYDISDDGLQYTFHLRPGVKFQTTDYFTPTREFNADDVMFSFERQWKKDHPWHQYAENVSWGYFEDLGLNELIESIDKVDDMTVRFKLNRKEAPFLADIAIPFASIVSKEYADQLDAKGNKAQLSQLPVGTGPFSYVEYQPDTVIRYDANIDYWGEKPKVENLVFAITTDASTRYQKLQAGECDLMSYPNAADVSAMKADPNLKVSELPGLNIAFLAYNTTQPPFDKADVRRALNMAINKQAIVDAVFQGAAKVAKNPLPPDMWSYNDAIEDDKYDPDAAKAALETAGVKDLSMNIWAMPVSRPYMLNARRAAELIQSDLARIGVTANIVTYEWAEYLQRSKDKNRDGAIILGWTGDNGDPDNFLGAMLSCSAVGSSNWAQWCDKEFDELVIKAKETTDQAERTRLYEQAQVVFKREAPWATLDHSLTVVVMRKNVQGFVQSPLGALQFDGVETSD